MEDVPKATFRTRYEHYKFIVMPFGLNDTPTTFIDLVNMVFKPFLDNFVMIFIDDILIFSSSQEEHKKCEDNIRNLEVEEVIRKVIEM